MTRILCLVGFHDYSKGSSYLYLSSGKNGELKKHWFYEGKCSRCQKSENSPLQEESFRNANPFLYISSTVAHMNKLTSREVAGYNRCLSRMCGYDGKRFRGIKYGRKGF